jgi:hypothetical protein
MKSGYNPSPLPGISLLLQRHDPSVTLLQHGKNLCFFAVRGLANVIE